MPGADGDNSAWSREIARGAALAGGPRRGVLLIRTRWLLLSMIVAVAAIGVLAFINEERRSEAELADLAREQRAVAEASIPRLASGTLGELARPGTTRVIVVAAARKRARSYRVTRDRASELGLPARTAMAGLAMTADGETIAIVSTAADQRDRDVAGQERLLGSILLA